MSTPPNAAPRPRGGHVPGSIRPIVLACDTSTNTGSVALIEGPALTAERLVTAIGNHSRSLVVDIRELLERRGLTPGDVDLLVTSVGPGSFTGIRISLAAMKGLAYALGRPLVGVGTLDALARPLLGRSMPVLVALDARKSEVYGACFDPAGMPTVAARAADPVLLARDVALAFPEGPILAAGEGILAWKDAFAGVLGDRLRLASPDEHVVRASVLARMALESGAEPVDPALIEPVYLRRSEAEVKLDAHTRPDPPEPAASS